MLPEKVTQRAQWGASIVLLVPAGAVITGVFGAAIGLTALAERWQAPLPLLRLTTWRKRRDWKRKHIPEDPYPMNGLTPLDHLILSKYAEEIR